MPVQTQMSPFAARLGARVAQAHAEHAGKPIDTGNRRLPGGIRNGIAKLSAMYTKQQAEDNAKTPKGETFFRASAVVMFPESHLGEKIAGMVTQVIIPLCDVPEKGKRKAVPFNVNWNDFRSLFVSLGIKEPDEKGTDEAAGQRIQAYYFAAMKTLCDPTRPPVYVEFSTRGWVPPLTPQEVAAGKKPNEEMVIETWHGLASAEAVAKLNGQYNPAAGVTEAPVNTAAVQPEPFEEPPTGQLVMPSANGEPADPADVVAALVEVAMSDPEGTTQEGAAASRQLEELAWGNGWTEEQTAGAANWEAVGNMCIDPPTTQPPITTNNITSVTPTVGTRAKFAKRGKDGAKLRNGKGEEIPPQEVEVVTVDTVAKTCTVKTTKDGKDVVDFRSKKPVPVKWEWLE